ncbi:MAG TPA: hypothetical protein VJ964_03335 [Balneolaceae bacterium]|nr:hypothetical protein [Balneolaceae bacterium]
MPNLRLKYLVDDYWDLIEKNDWDMPNLRPKYLIPDYKKLKRHNKKQLALKLKTKNTAA